MKTEWICWKLSRKDIERAAERCGIDPETLTTQDYEHIAETFGEELKKLNKQQWKIILEDKIERAVG